MVSMVELRLLQACNHSLRVKSQQELKTDMPYFHQIPGVNNIIEQSQIIQACSYFSK